MKKTRLLLLSVIPVLVLAALLFALKDSVFFAAVFHNRHCGISDALAAHKVWAAIDQQARSKEVIPVISEDRAAGLELRRTSIGDIWVPAHDTAGLSVVLAERAAHNYGSGIRGVQKGDAVIDCGAYIGTFASQALEAGARVVVAVEPAPEKIECLRRNLKSEIQAGRVIIYPKGVWDKEESLPLHKNRRHSGGDSFVLSRDATAEILRLTTIDRLVEELKLERVDFIKMDIEGAEMRALRGAASTIRVHHPRLALAVYHLPTDREEIPRQVRELWSGYQPECGVCELHRGVIMPDIVYFH